MCCIDEFNEQLVEEENDLESDDLSLFEDDADLDDLSNLSSSSKSTLSNNTSVNNSSTSAKASTTENNLTFMSKSVFTLVSNIFKCPVSEETLKNNISMSAPKIPFFNIRSCDPWLKTLNPNLVADCLESEIFTQKFISNFLRVAFPLINLLDAMSKGRVTQSRVETTMTDSLLFLSSSLENVNAWRRDNIIKGYNITHLQAPDVSPVENPYLFPSYFEKCAKFPSVDDLYQSNSALPDLEINAVSKFPSEAISGSSAMPEIDSKIQKMIREGDKSQKPLKDALTQTCKEVENKIATVAAPLLSSSSVGSQVELCKCFQVGLGSVTTAAGSTASRLNKGHTSGISTESDDISTANLGQQMPSATFSTNVSLRAIKKSGVAIVSGGEKEQNNLPTDSLGNIDKRTNVKRSNAPFMKRISNSSNVVTVTSATKDYSAAAGDDAVLPSSSNMNVFQNELRDEECRNDITTATSGADLSSGENSDIVEIIKPSSEGQHQLELAGSQTSSVCSGLSDFDNFASGITIEDNDDCQYVAVDNSDEGSDPKAASKVNINAGEVEMQSEIVILEGSDDAEEVEVDGYKKSFVAHSTSVDGTNATVYSSCSTADASISSNNEGNSSNVVSESRSSPKKKFVPITGPSPTTKTTDKEQQSSTNSNNKVAVKNSSKKRRPPIRPINTTSSANTTPPLESLNTTPKSSTTAFSSTTLNKNNENNMTKMSTNKNARTVTPLLQATVRGGGGGAASLSLYQHASTLANLGAQPQQSMSSSNAASTSSSPMSGRIVRATTSLDSYSSSNPSNFSPQLQNIPNKRARWETQQQHQLQPSQYGGNAAGVAFMSPTQQQQMTRSTATGLRDFQYQQQQQQSYSTNMGRLVRRGGGGRGMF